jgi:hypothetical protein
MDVTGMTAYQPSGDYYSASNPSGFITNDAITGLQPSGDYATHDDLTAYQTVEGMTAYQPSGNYADATALDGKVDTSSFTAFSSTTNEKIEYISGALSGTYELSAGNGIDITDYPNEQKTVISVTAQGGNPEVEQVVKSQSATWNSVTSKQDSLNFGYNNTAISSIDSSGLYDTSAHARINTLAGRINTLSSDKLDTTAFSTVSGDFLTAHQDLSDYATIASVAEKLDTTAFSTVSGDFLTAVDLTPYQTTAGMTAYQEAGNYLSASESANYYPMTGNPSGFLTELPAGTMNEAEFEYDANNKISAYNGSAFAGGSDVPEGVMSESGLEYNAVNEISGYNGSAIAQYGAEKQWLVHDDTLVHASNSAQYALGVNVSALQRLMGIDETVLFSADVPGGTITLSESPLNFKEIKMTYGSQHGSQITNNFGEATVYYDPTDRNAILFNGVFDSNATATGVNTIIEYYVSYTGCSGTEWTRTKSMFKAINASAWGGTEAWLRHLKIIGIGRKS